jgi:thiamine biosynthesis lipoprotein
MSERGTLDGRRGCASWEALGTNVVLRVTDPGALAAATETVERELDAIDRACSRFRADSELVRVNASGGRATQVSALLMEAIELALRAAELTEGDLDPTIGRALELAGYDRDWRHVSASRSTGPAVAPGRPSPEDRRSRPSAPQIAMRMRSGWRSVALDARGATVRVPRGIRLDLGATAKAWAADRAAAAAARAGGCGALVSVGGDIATCGAAPPSGWRVHVTDDHRSGPSAPGQTIAIFCGGLATSSTTVRRWLKDGQTMHHIIDPRTSRPAVGRWRTVSVAAASCAEANIATTAALVRGARAGPWLVELGLPARLVDHDGCAHRLGDWPSPRARELCA